MQPIKWCWMLQNWYLSNPFLCVYTDDVFSGVHTALLFTMGCTNTSVLNRSDRISHMRECFERASPDDLFLVLDTSGWDVQAACAVFQDSRSGESVQGGRPGKFVKGAPPNDSLLSLLFDNVAEGLQRRRRVAYPSHLRQPVDATRREMPSSSFSM